MRTTLLLVLLVALFVPVTAAQEVGIPDRMFGPGPLHKVLVRESDDAARELLAAASGVTHVENYGAFRLYVVDEIAFGGRKALEESGLPVRDELDLVAANGWFLDGAHAADSLARIPEAWRLGTVDDSMPLDAGLYLVQFRGPVRDAWLAGLMACGPTFTQYIPMNAYVVGLDEQGALLLADLARESADIQFATAWHPGLRLTPGLRAAADAAGGAPWPVTIQLTDGNGVRDAANEIGRLAARVHHAWRVGPYYNVQADVDPFFFREIARHPRVFHVEERPERQRLDERQGQIVAGNVSGSGPSSPSYLAWLASQGFGAGQFTSFSVNVVDDCSNLNGHPDLPASRIAFNNNPTGQSPTEDGHGFLNAHIVGGFNNGTGAALEDSGGYNYGLGIAPWAEVGVTGIFGGGGASATSWESTAYNQGARISSNSWGFIGAFLYNTSAQEFDFITRDARNTQGGNQELLVVFAAGNDGPGSDTVSSPATAKNIICVGASENNRQTGTDGCAVGNSGANDWRDIIGFSSRGPVNTPSDNRVKPDIMAPGTHIQAGVPQSNYSGTSICNAFWPGGQTLYGWSSGTSHSTPAVAGGAALLRQDFINNGQPVPSPALAKAFLMNTAEYMTGNGAGGSLPSNDQGMGIMHLGRAFDSTSRLLEDQSTVLSGTGASHVINGNVATSAQPFRVTLAWTDAPGTSTGTPYTNNLDLEVTVGGNTYRGNVFSGATSTTGGSFDFRNNVESVFLPAGVSGAFTITVTAANIVADGVPGNGDSTDQDFAVVVYNGQIGGGPAAPVANFTGTPTSGNAPHTVTFTDTSSGTVSSYSWTFGDGGTSTAQNPTHNYTSAGTYNVSLTVTGPGGSDTETKNGYIVVGSPPTPGINDGSFESQTPGNAPGGAWMIDFGTGHVINPDGGTNSDNGMPTDGGNWADLAADDTDGATPPSNPGGAGNAPVGGAGISQTFSYSAGVTMFGFDAAFIRNENANQAQFNDWMSVDVTDGTTTQNLYYADTFDPVPNTSAKHGLPMTAITSVLVDLATLFPGSSTSTVFTVTAQVGNGFDDVQPSRGYVDDFTLSGNPVPVSDFSATPTTGGAPLNVNFSDLSTGTISTWLWLFGDGGISTAQNPSHTYNNPGTYNVSLAVTGPGGSDSELKIGFITVTNAPPTAEFSGTPTTGTSPLNVSFSDLSTGSVTSWAWTFGDGGTSTAQNPSHTYTAAGTYSVTLTVTGPGGSDGETKSGYITVADPAPTAEFSATPVSGTSPLNVNFSDLSTGTITTWLWLFGDGGISTAQNPSHTYNNAGTYNVSLAVTGPGGSDSELKIGFITVTEAPPVAEFSGTPTSGTSPLNVSFMDMSTGNVTGWSWSFGDGGSSTAQNPSHTYTAAGTYNVTLTATGPGGSDGETKSGYVTVTDPAPSAEFSGTPVSGTNPLTVNFSDLSTGTVTSWLWAFGDGGSSTAQNPSHTYNSAGSYHVTLVATGPGGMDTEFKLNYITVSDAAPVADFSGTPTSGVSPLNVAFTDLTSGNVTSWAWTFGDGGTSTAQNPSHTYTTAGTYSVTLTATGPGGSDGETKSAYVTVSEPAPTAEFSGTPVSGTNPLTVNFSDLSTGVVTSWSWAFGDGGTSTAQNPSHTYTSAGTFSVTLVATGPGGMDTEFKLDYVTVNEAPPVADFSATPTSGTAPLLVSFTDLSTGSATSWSWTFGDGGTSTAQNPAYNYLTAGTFDVTLTTTGPGGSDVETKTGLITVAPQLTDLHYFSFDAATIVPGVGVVQDEDIVVYDEAAGTWSMHFDGSDVGLGGTDIDGFHAFADGGLLISLGSPTFNVPGLAIGPNGTQVTHNDIIYFAPVSTGVNTSGSFFFIFDGSDVGLETASEALDGVYLTGDGSVLLLSTVGATNALGVVADGNDMLVFLPAQFFPSTIGFFIQGIDGSDVGLDTADENLDSMHFDLTGGTRFSTTGPYSAGATGDQGDIARYVGVYGPNSSGTVTTVSDIQTWGIAAGTQVDGYTLIEDQ